MYISKIKLQKAMTMGNGRESISRLAKFEGLNEIVELDKLSDVELIESILLVMDVNLPIGVYSKIQKEREEEYNKLFEGDENGNEKN